MKKLRWYKAENESENVVASTINLIRLMEFDVTETTIKTKLKQDAAYPSLASIVNCLDEWKINSLAAELETEHLITAVPYPCIAHLKKNGGRFVVLKNVTETTVNYIDPIEGPTIKPLEAFLKEWSGNTLIVEATKLSGEVDYKKKLKEEKKKKYKGAILIGLMSFFLLLLVHFIGVKYAPAKVMYVGGALLCVHLLGLVVSILLVQTKYKANSSWTKVLCPVSETVSCDDVINSSGGKILGIELVDIGMVYFSGAITYLLLGGLAHTLGSTVWALAVLSLCSLPFTIYSVAYQWLVIKKWCFLCLLVVGVLWIHFLVHLIGGTITISTVPNWFDLLLIAPSYLVVMVAWFGIKSMIPAVLNEPNLKNELARFSILPQLLQSLIADAPIVDLAMLENWVLLVLEIEEEEEEEEEEVPQVLSVILSPTCPPCNRSYFEIIRFAKGKVPLQIMLLSNKSNEDETRLVSYRIQSYVKQQQNPKALEALTYWFELSKAGKSTKLWFEKYPAIEEQEEKYEAAISKNWNLLYQQNINSIPSLILGDRLVSNEYGMDTAKAVIRKMLN